MEVVTGATTSLLPKLGALLRDEYNLQDKVKRDIQSLQKELMFMNATLLMVAEEPADKINPLVRTWATLIKELSYDMEDVVNSFMAEVHGDGTRLHLGGFQNKAFNILCLGTTHHRIADMIEELKSLTKELTELRDRYRLDNTGGLLNGSSSGSGDGATQAVTYGIAAEDLEVGRQLIRTENPVGVKIDLEKLWCRLTKDDKHSCRVAVLSIVGFGGVGKTTIATALYRDFGNQFDCRASVTVSQSFDQDDVLRDILRQIKPQENAREQQDSSRTQKSSEKKNRDLLIKELKTRLEEKRYLLLFDDIWSAETWRDIRNWLPLDNTKYSRVIVTTRFQAVGAACSETEGTDYLHPVDYLSPEDSEILFNHSVSEIQRNDSGKPEAHGDIWKYCGGLPLAIVTVAGLAASKKDDRWNKVHKSLFQEKGVSLSQDEKVPPLTLDGVTRILDYCYNDLPPDLKTCSLYLSIFPGGVKISMKRLIRRWISERFAIEKQGLTAEEVAETYINQLIRRKIIHPVEHTSNGKVKSFEIHSMMLEYIVSKSSEENFVTVIGGHGLMPTPSNKIRRLAIQSSCSKHGNSIEGMNFSQVRSLTLFGSKTQLPFHSLNNGLIEVLDLESWKGLTDKHMGEICKMVRLKYLSLRRTDVSEIPSKIENLQYLETLDIRETNVGVLPRAFGHLKRLHNMLGGSKNSQKTLKMPQGKNKVPMKALRVLSGIEITEDWAKEACLNQFTGLRKLAIYKLNIQEGQNTFVYLSSSIEYLCRCGLQTLEINDESSNFINSLDSMTAPPRYLVGLELSGKMEKAPKWIVDLKNLYKLTLSVTVLKTDTFKLIQDLSKLFSLTFTLSAPKDDRDIVDILEENKKLTGREIIVPPGGFKSLKLLRFFATLVPRLSFAVTGEEVMPALERIDMQFQAFEGIYGIETLESLQEVHLSVDNKADEITKLLVKDLKDTPYYLDIKYVSKWPKIITE